MEKSNALGQPGGTWPCFLSAPRSFSSGPSTSLQQVAVSFVLGMMFSAAYRTKLVHHCFKFNLGRRIHSIFPVAIALCLHGFYIEAGLYLVMDGESGIWHVLVGLWTLIGGGYFSWYVYGEYGSSALPCPCVSPPLPVAAFDPSASLWAST